MVTIVKIASFLTAAGTVVKHFKCDNCYSGEDCYAGKNVT